LRTFQFVFVYTVPMFTFRGRTLAGKDIEFINALINENPGASRRALSKKLCLAWNWVQPNGALRDMVCRGMMLELHRAGLIYRVLSVGVRKAKKIKGGMWWIRLGDRGKTGLAV